MGGVIKKKKKTLFAKIVGKIKGEQSPTEQQYIAPDVPLGEIRINNDDAHTILLRRKELKTAKHGNKDATITFDGNS